MMIINLTIHLLFASANILRTARYTVQSQGEQTYLHPLEAMCEGHMGHMLPRFLSSI